MGPRDPGVSGRPYQVWTSTVVPGTQNPFSHAPGLTLAFELLGRCGKQKFALHVRGSGTAGNARLLVASLHPAGQPSEAAVTIQGVGTNGSGTGSRKNGHPKFRSFEPVSTQRCGLPTSPCFNHSICIILLGPHYASLHFLHTETDLERLSNCPRPKGRRNLGLEPILPATGKRSVLRASVHRHEGEAASIYPCRAMTAAPAFFTQCSH